MISTQITRASAAVLLLAGLALLFAADVILPRLVPEFPARAAWIGQLLAASWLAVGTLNWLSRSVLLGGIYGRAMVLTNAVLYFVAAMVLLNLVIRSNAPAAVWVLVVPTALFAAVYAWLLFRGRFDRDFEIHRRSQQDQA